VAAQKDESQAAPVRGVVGRPASTSMFDLDRWVPSESSGRFVEHFWSVTWDLKGQEPLLNAVITFPSMHVTHEWVTDGPRHRFALRNTLVHGVVERVFRTTISGSGTVVGARFLPGGFAARSGRDAADLTEPVDDVVRWANTSRPHRRSGRCGPRRGDRRSGGDPDPNYTALTALVERMRDDDRLHRVDQVMALSPWSARTTQRVFRRYVGVPVKWVLCRYRLQQAALDIESRPGVDFADLAVRLGWYDQAHFVNDFRAMLGVTPGEFADAHGG